MLGRLPAASPESCGWLEPVFERRIEDIFGFAFDGGLSSFLGCIIPRTSEPEYKLFLYLSEIRRQRRGALFPEPYLYNLLHTRSEVSYSYGLARTRELWNHLAGLCGAPRAETHLAEAVAQSNARLGVMRLLLQLRTGHAPRLSGSQAAALLGASYFMDSTEYIATARAALDELAALPPLAGPHILIKGAPLMYTTLHREVESCGAVVTGEDDWWAERAVGADLRTDTDPLIAVFEKYYLDAPSPRVFPPECADRWFQSALMRDIQGVVLYVPPEDDVLGWDTPRHIATASARGVPCLVVRDEANQPQLPERARLQIAEFVGSLRAPERTQE